MKNRVHSHARSDVIASRWDEKANAGFWTFRCQSCGHSWEEKAVYTGHGPLLRKPLGKAAWSLFSRYWGPKSGGVKTKCPKCGAGK